MKVLFLSPEVSPWSKTGGLGDVAGALPRALAERGHDLTVVSPLPPRVDRALVRPLGKSVSFDQGSERLTFELLEGLPVDGSKRCRVIFMAHPLFERPELYGDYPDNFFRFAAFGEAALAVPAALGFVPQIVHGNDWTCGPAVWRAHERRLGKQVFTIHNLAYQGLFNASALRALGWPEQLFHPEALEFYGQLSFMKAGLVFADAITTVSPTYAREIRTPDLGCGLDGLLQKRSGVLSGILNGIDDVVWNPRTDPHLTHRYGPGHMSGKAACKLALQRELGLPLAPRTPLFTMVSRFVEQKGFDLLLEVLDDRLFERAQVAILGNGEQRIADRLLAIARPQAFAVRVAFDDGLAHRLGAAGDFFLVPSRFEPCGLSQMYAMRYGTLPVVRATGGLADTVNDLDAPDATGIVFEPYTADALRAAIDRAIAVYERNEIAPIQAHGMARDFSWAKAAIKYEKLYERLNGSGA
jgi:starch synthase